MDITPTTIILVGVVCVFLGILGGVLLNTLSEDDDTPAAIVDEAPPGGRKGRYTPVARLWRERGAGTLVVEMDGKAMVSAEPLNEVQRERLEKSARDLRAWLGMGLAGQAQATSAEPAQSETSEIDLSRVIPPVPVEAPAPKKQPSPAPAVVSRSPSPSISAQKGAAAQPAAPKGKEEPATPLAAKSIVMQVEDILQDMIAETPLAQRGIHLTEDPARGVIVQVGLERYEGIDAVPDPEIKKVIQSAVQVWENSQ